MSWNTWGAATVKVQLQWISWASRGISIRGFETVEMTDTVDPTTVKVLWQWRWWDSTSLRTEEIMLHWLSKCLWRSSSVPANKTKAGTMMMVDHANTILHLQSIEFQQEAGAGRVQQFYTSIKSVATESRTRTGKHFANKSNHELLSYRRILTGPLNR